MLLATLCFGALAETERRTSLVKAIERVRPSVVTILIGASVPRPRSFSDKLFGQFLNRDPEEIEYVTERIGSGVLVRPNGYLVTSAHVIASGQKITVALADKREYEASIVGTDPTIDLAVLKIPVDDLPYVRFRDSDSILVGEPVIAIGNHLGFSHLVTTGVVSALGGSDTRNADSSTTFIQTDAVINAGSSGGALLDAQGFLIGISTLTDRKIPGIAFAVPTNQVRRVLARLLRKKL